MGGALQDRLLCNTQLQGATATTNTYGEAEFNLTFVSGLPGNYLLTLSAPGRNLTTHVYVHVSSPVVALSAAFAAGPPTLYDEAFGVTAALTFERQYDQEADAYLPPAHFAGAQVAVTTVSIDGRHWFRNDIYNRNLILTDFTSERQNVFTGTPPWGWRGVCF